MRIVGYARVSTREQSKNTHALEQQIARLKQAGATEIFCDVESGRQGRGDLRPDYNRLMKLVRKKEVQQVIITRLDRLTRSLPTLRRAVDDFRNTGVNLVALDDSIDMATAAGKFHLNMLGALAEMESDRLSERILNGKEHFRACMRASHAPFGYRVNNYRYELDTEPFLCSIKDQNEYSRAEMAYDLVENYLERKSLNGTCRYFTDRWGYDEFWASALRRWLTSQTLQGHLVYFPKSEKPIVNLNTHEPLITPEQASQIKEVIAFNHKIGGFGATRGKYPLTSLVVCSECGIRWVIGNGSKGEYKYFLCPKARQHACSQKKSIRQEVLEQAVVTTLTAKAQELSLRGAMSTTPTEPLELKELRSQLAGLEAIPGYNPTIEQAKEEITRQIQNLTYSSNLNQTSYESDQNFLRQVFSCPDFWSSLSDEGKQRAFRRLVDRVEVRDGAVVAVHLRV